MSYFILEKLWISHITIFTLYGFLRSSNLTSVIKQFNISYIFLLVFSITRPYFITIYMKNLLPNIYLVNNKNKQRLKAKQCLKIPLKLKDIQILKSFFTMTTGMI